MSTLYARRTFVAPFIIPEAAGPAVEEALAREEQVRTLKKERDAAEAVVLNGDATHAAKVRAAIEDGGKPSPPRDSKPADDLADAELRLDAAQKIKAEAVGRALAALIEAAPSMVERMPNDVRGTLEDIEEHGLTEDACALIEHSLAALRFYKDLSKAPGTHTWRPLGVEVPASASRDLLGNHRAAVQAALGRLERTPGACKTQPRRPMTSTRVP